MIYDLRFTISRALEAILLLLGEKAGMRAVRKQTSGWIAAILLLLCCSAPAADTYTVLTVTITNQVNGIATNGTDTLTVIGDTRTATNNIASDPSKLWLGTNAQLRATTNLYNHIALYAFGSASTRLSLRWLNTNQFQLAGQINQAVAGSAGGVWGTVVSTNYPITNRTTMFSPAIAASAITQTNFGNAIADYLNVAQTFLNQTAAALSNFLSLHQPQTASNKTFQASAWRAGEATGITNLSGTNFTLTTGTIASVTITAGTYSGIISALTNGSLYSNLIAFATLTNPITLNLVNYGNAIRSEGAGGNSLQVGSNATASGSLSMAIGNNALASSNSALAVGTSAIATNTSATAVGNAARAAGENSLAMGYSSVAGTNSSTALGAFALASAEGASAFGRFAAASGYFSVALGTEDTIASGPYSLSAGIGANASQHSGMALGALASSSHSNSAAIGPADHTGTTVITTTTNQIRLGTANEHVSIPGRAEITGNLDLTGKAQFGTATNNTWTGTNILNGRLDLTARANTGLANGYNSGVIFGTNAYIRFSGPSGAYTNVGFGAPGGPQRVIGQFSNPGLSFTLLDESGLEATAANRILTGTGALLNSTNNPCVVDFLYDDSASRWRVLSFR